ncbi:MAG: glycogen debranching protein GlgX [Simkaniaceae bacterium]
MEKAAGDQIKVKRGYPGPLGACERYDGINFAVFSKNATHLYLCLFKSGEGKPFKEISLDPQMHRTGDIWHVLLENLPKGIEYAYRCLGPNSPAKGHLFNKNAYLFDPYSIELSTNNIWGKNTFDNVRSKINHPAYFDWGKDLRPKIHLKDLIIYEMHVRGFTKDPSSDVKNPGTFAGIIEKIPYLKKLGINAVELMPIHEFDENENMGKGLYNYWGYSPASFFALMKRYAATDDVVLEFKKMVKELHKNQIEVILDVVFNHTAEGSDPSYYLSFRGLDNSQYYLLNPDGTYANYSGCGNTVNCNSVVVEELILDTLKYYVSELHVDGFRFDLASILTRDENGNPMEIPPVVRRIAKDPVLSGVKLIAEAWDPGGLYQVGQFPHFGQWAEWNGHYRDTIRRFIKGTDGETANFAKVITGSEELYSFGRAPYHSINFVTAHDGFTLHDLVSYQEKHNELNLEDNRDGCNYNNSWNCGVEGETDRIEILNLRKRQMKNFMVALLCSIGTPMILMGDEYGHTRYGNNNAWSQDNELNYFLWDQLDKNKDFFRFVCQLINFRKQHGIFRRKKFLTSKDISWHGVLPFSHDWSHFSRFIACTMHDHEQEEHLYIAFNAYYKKMEITLPEISKKKTWHRIVDTNLESPKDFVEDPFSNPIKKHYFMAPYSSFIAKLI